MNSTTIMLNEIEVAVPSGALVAVYLDSEGRAVLVEDLKGVRREGVRRLQMREGERTPRLEGRVMSFRGTGYFVRCCYVNGKCYPCALLEFLIIAIVQFVVGIFQVIVDVFREGTKRT
jgi:hypothetical protein